MTRAPKKTPAEKADPRKWTRRAEARPEEILDAALAEFTDRGFEAARMEDVAKRAGLSKAGVYLYFPSKEALLKALVDSRVLPIVQGAVSAGPASIDDPKTALRMIAAAIVRGMGDPRVFAVPRLIISIAAQFPDLAIFYRERVGEPARAALESLFAAGIAKGVFRDIEPAAAARAFIGPILFEALWTHILRGVSALDDSERLADSHLNILLEGLEKRA